ncbi:MULTISPECIES: type I phosphomannose isomerase catalytic subunit [unclassified Flavobacterium]|jgi:mannose-6-phosphate isomerase|uniref:type I phosphomannose isomerase catalytic subunit n=1 Tax=unclassified Flavobacterium TaxID=196869 RepID=UPI0025C33E38|nr:MULTISPECIES: type I phosphomannose isomerase catalytic subunit [unclassified Flavobacterium]
MSVIENTKDQIPLYPIRFEPIYQYRIWGGRQLANLLTAPLPDNDPIGEAWMLSDRDDHASLVGDGPLKGQTIGQLMKKFQEQMMGKLTGKFNRFPLLLKFLDAHERLSVQVHPSDMQKDFIPEGEHGKTEAWVVLKSGHESRIYEGLKSGTTAEKLRQSIANGTVEEHLSYFTPKCGDSVFLPAGTVHALGGDIVVFEVQQNSDVTFRLYDWNHIDAKTGQPRALQIDQAIACIDFTQGEKASEIPVLEEQKSVLRERLFQCEYFRLWRLSGKLPFTVGEKEIPRVLVCIDGEGKLKYNNTSYIIRKGDVWLLPAIVGSCLFCPNATVSLLEIALPE